MAWTPSCFRDLWGCWSDGAKRRFLEVKISRESSFSEMKKSPFCADSMYPSQQKLRQGIRSYIHTFGTAIDRFRHAEKKKGMYCHKRSAQPSKRQPFTQAVNLTSSSVKG